jgi:carbon monoxide dehydrogenase subunit G
MGEAQVQVRIDRPADEVWKVVGDFGGLAGWLPGVESCRLEGDERILAMMGMEVTERLVRRDDAKRVIAYGITGGIPVERHQATITVEPDGDASRVTWVVDVAPDSMTDMMKGAYEQGLQALKAHVER